jgi:hypothetical protein
MERSMGPLRCFGRTHQRDPEPIRNHRPLLWRLVGPSRCISKTHRRSPGPIQNHRALLWGNQWAHTDASARLTEEILGPYKIIDHFYGEINGPIQMLQ